MMMATKTQKQLLPHPAVKLNLKSMPDSGCGQPAGSTIDQVAKWAGVSPKTAARILARGGQAALE
jgi:hypothetical protein